MAAHQLQDPRHRNHAYSWMVTAAELCALAARIILAQPTDYVYLESKVMSFILPESSYLAVENKKNKFFFPDIKQDHKLELVSLLHLP